MNLGHNLHIFRLIYDIRHLRWISVHGNNSIPDHDSCNRNRLNYIHISCTLNQSVSSTAPIPWLSIAKKKQIINMSLFSFSSFQALVMVLIQSIDFFSIPTYSQQQRQVVPIEQCIIEDFLVKAVILSLKTTLLNRFQGLN